MPVAPRPHLVSCVALVLALGISAPAWGHGGVYFEGSFGVPFDPYVPYYAPVYPWPGSWYEPPPPPAAWERGHWETRYDRRGRLYRVWIPTHLR
jgi:hypothetical protein